MSTIRVISTECEESRQVVKDPDSNPTQINKNIFNKLKNEYVAEDARNVHKFQFSKKDQMILSSYVKKDPDAMQAAFLCLEEKAQSETINNPAAFLTVS